MSINEVIAKLNSSLRKKMSKELRERYDTTFKLAVSDHSTVQQLASGSIPVTSTLHAIEQGLQAVQSCLDDPEPQQVGLYWNPTIATLLMSHRAMVEAKAPKNAHAAKTPRPDGQKPFAATKGKNASRIDSPSKKSGKAAAKTKPASKVEEAPSSSRPRSPDYLPAEILDVQPVDESFIRRDIEITIAGGGPYLRDLRMGCKSTTCEWCKQLVNHTPLTRCKGHKPCSKSGWWPHVGPNLWFKLSKAHQSGTPYRPRNTVKIPKGGLQPLVSYTPGKRRHSDDQPLNEPLAKMVVTEEYSTSSWASEVEESIPLSPQSTSTLVDPSDLDLPQDEYSTD